MIEEPVAPPTREEIRLIKAELDEYERKYEREDNAKRRWTCLECGNVMDYAYMMEGRFDDDGCSACGHTQAIEQREAATDE